MVKFTLFFLSLSLLIILHEFGHYITARWFKTRVDKFYLFFDFLFPFGNLLKFSLFKKKIGDTTYGLGWFPFGGYVDIAGMAAEPGSDPDTPPAPDEFRGKKPWQRLIILAGGVTVNALLAVIIYTMMSWVWGEKYLPTASLKFGVSCDSVALKAGFLDGDKILKVDNQSVENFQDITTTIIFNKAKSVLVERNGTQQTIDLDPELFRKVISEDAFLFSPRVPFVVDRFEKGSIGEAAGMMKGDSVIALNGDTTVWLNDFIRELKKHKNEEITVTVVRSGQYKDIKMKLDEEARTKALPKEYDYYFTYNVTEYSFVEAIGRGFSRTGDAFTKYVKQLPLLFTKEGASKVGGFASMGSVFPAEWDWQGFWRITAMLSVILAFMNLLPIPVLDGGYILFVLWEMITGRKPGEKFMRIAMNVGTFMVLALLIFANGNDLWKFVIKPLVGG